MSFNLSAAQKGILSPYDGILLTVTGGDQNLYFLVKAIIAKESAWNPQAIRQEPQLHDASRGLMQVLYSTAQDMGYGGDATGLFDPATNIQTGVAFLQSLISRYPNILDAISAYNGGHPLTLASGAYANQSYVDDVLAYWSWYAGNEPTAPTVDGTGGTVDTTGDGGFFSSDLGTAGGIGIGMVAAVLLVLVLLGRR